MRRIVVALLLFVNGAAAATAQPAPGEQNLPKPAPAKQAVPKQAPATRDGKCVGVVSHIGEKFTVKKVGIVVFQNEENEVPIESWRIDDLVVAKIGGFLNKQAAVRRIAYPKGAFASLETPKLFRNYDADLGEIVRTVAAGTRCTRYVVVTPGVSGYGNTNQNLGGLGIVAGGWSFGNVNLHALITLRVYDGETFAPLTRKAASDGKSTFFAMIGGPHREVDKSFWPDPFGVAPQNAKLRDAIRELVGQSLETTLPELHLTE